MRFFVAGFAPQHAQRLRCLIGRHGWDTTAAFTPTVASSNHSDVADIIKRCHDSISVVSEGELCRLLAGSGLKTAARPFALQNADLRTTPSATVKDASGVFSHAADSASNAVESSSSIGVSAGHHKGPVSDDDTVAMLVPFDRSQVSGRTFRIVGVYDAEMETISSAVAMKHGRVVVHFTADVDFIVVPDEHAALVAREVAQLGLKALVISKTALWEALQNTSAPPSYRDSRRHRPSLDCSYRADVLASDHGAQSTTPRVNPASDQPQYPDFFFHFEVPENAAAGDSGDIDVAAMVSEPEQMSPLSEGEDDGESAASHKRKGSSLHLSLASDANATASSDWRHLLGFVMKSNIMRKRLRQYALDDPRQYRERIVPSIWYGARAFLSGRTVQQEHEHVAQQRLAQVTVLDKVASFVIAADDESIGREMVLALVDEVAAFEDLYPNIRAIEELVPAYTEPKTVARLAALRCYANDVYRLALLFRNLQKWSGSDVLAAHDPVKIGDERMAPLAEQLTRDRATWMIFQERAVAKISPLLITSVLNWVACAALNIEMNIGSAIDNPYLLFYFYTNLMDAMMAIRLRTFGSFAADADTDAIFEAMGDLKDTIRHSCWAKHDLYEVIARSPYWQEKYVVHVEYERLQFKCLELYMGLFMRYLQQKSLEMDDQGTIDVYVSSWSFLCEICVHVMDAEVSIMSRMLGVSAAALARDALQMRAVLSGPVPATWSKAPELYFANHLQHMNTHYLQSLRVQSGMLTAIMNAAEYFLSPRDIAHLMKRLALAGYVLVESDEEECGDYIVVAHPSWQQQLDDVHETLHACVVNPSAAASGHGAEGKYLVVAKYPRHAWTGSVCTAAFEYCDIDLAPDTVRLVVCRSGSIQHCMDNFVALCRLCKVNPCFECINPNNRTMRKQMGEVCAAHLLHTRTGMELLPTAHLQTGNADVTQRVFQALIGITLHTVPYVHREQQIEYGLDTIRLTRLWLDFVTSPEREAKRLFRWGVAALEAALRAVQSDALYELPRDEFEAFRAAVARCMRLVLVQYDQPLGRTPAVQRARDVAAMRETRAALLARLETAREQRRQQQHLAGRVVDRAEIGLLAELAAARSSVTFRWQKLRYIGSGAASEVYLVHRIDRGEMLAMKVLRVGDISMQQRIIRKVALRERIVAHANIARFYGIEVRRDRVFLFLEYCNGASLAEYLDDGGAIRDEPWVRARTLQLLHALAHLHAQRIEHRDIKPANIMLDEHENVKLIDFDMARVVAEDVELRATDDALHTGSFAGTPVYMAPEVVTRAPRRLGSVDVWAVGCCVSEMVTGKRPWQHLESEWSILYHLATSAPLMPTMKDCSAFGIDFVRQCFIISAVRRPAAAALMQHQFLRDTEEWGAV